MGKSKHIKMSFVDQEVVLLSKDETEVKLKFGIAMMSETIKALSSFPEDPEDQDEWEVPDASIPLPPVEGAILQKDEKEDATEAWDKAFAAVDDDTLFSLILAANYLDIKPLLDLTCKTVADYIKQCKTPQEIRRRFNIKNDFTPEEEEEVRKENAWCEER